MRITAPEPLQRGRHRLLTALCTLSPQFSFAARTWFASRASLVSVASTAALALAFSSLSACDPARGTIGAVIAQDDLSGRLFVRDVPAGLAAAKAGVQAGDEILLIDGLDVRSMNSHQIHAALAGDVDAPVKLTLIRGEQVVRATLKRTEARKLVKSRRADD